MVLIMLCTTTCMVFGIDDYMQTYYPYQIQLKSSSEGVPPYGEMRDIAERTLSLQGLTPTESVYFRSLSISCGLMVDAQSDESRTVLRDAADDYITIAIMPLEDYNAVMRTEDSLKPGEALAFGPSAERIGSRLTLFDRLSYTIAGHDLDMPIPGSMITLSTDRILLLVTPDEHDLLTVAGLYGGVYGRMPPELKTIYAFDTTLPAAQHALLGSQIQQSLYDAGLPKITLQVAESVRSGIHTLDVGCLALGILLSLAFLCVTALSMYYKQIMEGVEDQSRFDIMRRVGLSREMIRRSINSQLLILFFSPLLLSGVHLAFAFPMLTILLQKAFNLVNTGLLVMTTLVTYAVVVLIYGILYALTAREYERIVTGLSES